MTTRPESVPALAHRLVRRERALQALHGLIVLVGLLSGSAGVAIALKRFWLPALPIAPVVGVLGALLLLGGAWIWRRARPDPLRLLLRADREFQGAEQLSTAWELRRHDPGHPFLPALLARGEALAARVEIPRLLRFAFTRREAAVGAFAGVALALLLVPPAWLRVTTSPRPSTEALIVAEGRRLERLGERLQALAEQEAYRKVAQLAEEIDRAAHAFQKRTLAPGEAVRRLRELAALAASLAARELPAGGAEGRGEEEGETARQPAGTARTARVEQGLPPGRANFAPDKTDTVSDRARAETDAWQPGMGGSEEGELLRQAQAELRSSANNLERSFTSPDSTPPASLEEVASQSEDDTAAEDLPDTGQRKPATGQTAKGLRLGDPGDDQAVGETAEAAAARNEKHTPQEVGFRDVQAVGAPDETLTETVWLHQLATEGAVPYAMEGGVPAFQRTTVTVQGGAEIPRAHWSTVRSYFHRVNEQRGDPR